jgi:hypothetical protein
MEGQEDLSARDQSKDSIDFYISIDEFLRVVEREGERIGLNLSLEGEITNTCSIARDLRQPCLPNKTHLGQFFSSPLEGQEGKFVQKISTYVLENGEVRYRVRGLSLDFHGKNRIGRDSYESLLSTAQGEDVLSSAHSYSTSRPDTDDSQFLPEPFSKTLLLAEDPLARRIFELIKNRYQSTLNLRSGK